MIVRVVVCGCLAVWQCAAVRGGVLCTAVRAAVCGIVWLCVAVRLIGCGNARSSVRAVVRTIVYGSALGSTWQRARQCAAVWQCGSVRQQFAWLVVYGSARGKLWQCYAAVRQCGSVQQFKRLCATAHAAVCV